MADETTERPPTGSNEAPEPAERLDHAARVAGDAMQHAAEQARDAFREHVVEPARRAGDAAMASAERAGRDGSALGTRMIDQAEANTREAFAAMRAAAQAKDSAEVLRIQGDYLREQGQRSMAQAREIGEMIARFGREAVTGVGTTGDGPPRS